MSPTGTADARGDLRVIGVQYLPRIDAVESYASFRRRLGCVMQDLVVPLIVPGRPTLVVFNEDIGLMTVATGRRGALARQQAQSQPGAPAGDQAPVGAASVLGQLNAQYAPQVAAYQQRFGPLDPRKALLLAATDTFARAFSQTFSDLARDYGVYVVAGNNQAAYRASRDPVDVAFFADPEAADPSVAFVAVNGRVPSTAYVWGPQDLHPDAPTGERKLISRNEKVPLTQTENDLLALDPGPSTGPAAVDNLRGPVIAGHRLGIATSLPAFQYGFAFGAAAPTEPCANVAVSYMACLDSLGADVVVQDEANPGRWATYNPGGWQPLEWMGSTWRAAAEPSVHFRYNITPHLVGNLLDLPFDGQSAITTRAAGQPGRHYVGTTEPLDPRDPPAYGVYAGAEPQFLALAPWVVPDSSRTALAAVAADLSPGSGSARENGYVQTAVFADLLLAGAAAAPSPAAGPAAAPSREAGPGAAPSAAASPGAAPSAASPGAATALPVTGGSPPWPAAPLLAPLLALARHRSSRRTR